MTADDRGDELALGVGVVLGIAHAGWQNRAFLGLVGVAQRGVGAQKVAEAPQRFLFRAVDADQVHVQAVASAGVLDRADSHRPLFRKYVAYLLVLKSERVDRLARGFELARRISRHQIDDAFARTTGNGSASDVLDLRPRRRGLDQRGPSRRSADRAGIVLYIRGVRVRVWQDLRHTSHS